AASRSAPSPPPVYRARGGPGNRPGASARPACLRRGPPWRLEGPGQPPGRLRLCVADRGLPDAAKGGRRDQPDRQGLPSRAHRGWSAQRVTSRAGRGGGQDNPFPVAPIATLHLGSGCARPPGGCNTAGATSCASSLLTNGATIHIIIVMG